MDQGDIHQQLLADCHYLGVIPSGSLLLHRNAVIPWCILVPDTPIEDLLQLDTNKRNQVMDDAQKVAAFLQAESYVERINIAALGNVVPQLHVHVIGRHAGDACWPKPVWGNVTEARPWESATVARFRSALCD